MADSNILSGKRLLSRENKKHRSTSSLNLRARMHCKADLKSSIPKPTPLVRSKEMMRAKSSSSSQSQPIHPSRIPVPLWSTDRGKTSSSLQYHATSSVPSSDAKRQLERFSELRHHNKSLSPPPRPKSESTRPKSASVFRNPYPNVKAKVNSKPPVVSKLRSKLSPLNVRLVATPDSTTTENSKADEPGGNSQSSVLGEERRISNEELQEKKRQILNLYNELKKIQLPKELKPLENEVCRLLQTTQFGYPEGLSRDSTLLLSEGSPEFLMSFEKQMQELTEGWLRLICDIVSTKMAVGNASLSRLSLPDPTLNIREEVFKFLSSLPSEGEALHTKLQNIEKEQLKMVAAVMHSAFSLYKQLEELKDSHFRLEKTQDQVHFELKEQIAILGEENQELDRKYERAVEKYNKERMKTEQQEKYKMTISRELLDMKKTMKVLEGRCRDWELRSKKVDVTCRNLEVAVKTLDHSLEKESRGHQNVLEKLKESRESIEKLKAELSEAHQTVVSLQMANKELNDDLLTKASVVEELEQSRKELIEELSSKAKTLAETEERMNSIQAYISNSSPGMKDMYDISAKIPIEGLLKENHQKDIRIQELKKEVNHMEHILKEKKTREEMLMMQVTELQKQPLENEVALRSQIKELQYELKDMSDEKAELERIIAQKTLELDQRDLLMREHSMILRARDELIPMVQSKQRREKECIEKLSTIIVEQQKTYFNKGDEEYPSNGEPNLQDMMKALEKRYSLDPKQVDKELTFRQEKMAELFNLLEHKQMEMMRLERRIRELQGVREEKEVVEREKEARISYLQRELDDRRSGKSRGIFSLFSGQDGSC